jgi:hypothetical protein
MNHDEIWENLNQELWDRRTEMTEMKIAIARLTKERDEARREAYRQWLIRQCDAEHEYGTHDEYIRLAEIYKAVFKEYPLSSMFESSDPAPYELPIGTEGVQ